ncbi:MAG: hypothetical protein ACP6IY_07435 [Promethearchaeia archaeon]
MGKAKLTISLDEKILKQMEKIRDEIGLPISTQIEMKLKGYSIIKNETLEKCGLKPFNFDD